MAENTSPWSLQTFNAHSLEPVKQVQNEIDTPMVIASDDSVSSLIMGVVYGVPTDVTPSDMTPENECV